MSDPEGGAANIEHVEKFFHDVQPLDPLKTCRSKSTVYVIKSTVPIGTTDSLCEKYSTHRILHSPEFLTAKHSDFNFITASRHIIGRAEYVYDSNGAGAGYYSAVLEELLSSRFPGVNIIKMFAKESELVKYFANSFFATKVMFFNEMKLLSDQLDLNWENIISGVMSDRRIGMSHYQVPGHDNDVGFGGYCFPKDINALINSMKEHDVDPLVLEAVWKQNKNIRNNWDWVDSDQKEDT